jgi:hypothetical protein
MVFSNRFFLLQATPAIHGMGGVFPVETELHYFVLEYYSPSPTCLPHFSGASRLTEYQVRFTSISRLRHSIIIRQGVHIPF